MAASSYSYQQEPFRSAEEIENAFACVPLRPVRMIDAPCADGECLDNEVTVLEMVTLDDISMDLVLSVSLRSSLDLTVGNFVTVTCDQLEICYELNAHLYVSMEEFGLDPM